MLNRQLGNGDRTAVPPLSAGQRLQYHTSMMRISALLFLAATFLHAQEPNILIYGATPAGIAALTTADGRATIMMPHPERVFRTVQNSWHPHDAGEDSGWMRLFRNARVWVD